MITAAAPLPVIMGSLRRAGLGPLAARDAAGLVAVLDGLTAILPHRSAQGWVTAPQLADASARSERWTRRCLGVLEDAGIVRWVRGGIVDGKPAPSWVRVSKQTLVDLIARSRPALEAVRAARARATAARIAAAARLKRPGTYRRSPDHPALDASPNPPKGGSAPHSLPRSCPQPNKDEQEFEMRPDRWTFEPCRHGGDPRPVLIDGEMLPHCPSCRAEARWRNSPTVPDWLAER